MSLLVVGAGVSGMAAAGLATRLGTPVTVFDSSPDSLERAAESGYATVGPDWDSAFLSGFDEYVISPGIPPWSEIGRDAVGAISEIEYGFRHTTTPIIAVTGTNGKTTVTGATAGILSANGVDAVACGNIGLALSDVADQPRDVLVVEVSSFQLHAIRSFRPDIAVILNVAPDHLDWHGSFEAYAAAKGRITENQTIDDICIANKNDPVVRELVAFTAATVELVEAAALVQVDGSTIELPEALDAAFSLDLVAAIRAASHFTIKPEPTQTWIEGFETGPHRRQLVEVLDGVAYVNDSKATNPHAASMSVLAYPGAVVIAGGRNKNLDLTPLVDAKPQAVVAIGEAADELLGIAARSRIEAIAAHDMRDAVRKAADLARPGDTVLLAPGCTSFDMYENYQVRGEDFAREVRDLAGRSNDSRQEQP